MPVRLSRSQVRSIWSEQPERNPHQLEAWWQATQGQGGEIMFESESARNAFVHALRRGELSAVPSGPGKQVSGAAPAADAEVPLDARLQDEIGGIVGAAGTGGPGLTNVELEQYFRSLGRTLPVLEHEVMPAMSRIQARAATAQREADIADVERLGPRASAAFRASNPELYGMMEEMAAAAEAIPESEIGQELDRQALDELRLGSELSPAATRTAQQQARAAWSARGLVESPAAAAEEVLRQYEVGQERLRERRGFAGAREAERLRRLGIQSGMREQAARWYARTKDPFMQILGRSAVAPGYGFTQQQFASGFGPRAQDWLSYGSGMHRQASEQEFTAEQADIDRALARELGEMEITAAERAGRRERQAGFGQTVLEGIFGFLT